METEPKRIAKPYGKDGVFAVIVDERSHQDRKWGTVEEHPHEVGSWILIMESLLADARSAWSGNRGDAGALDEIRKVCAVGVACMEQHGVVHRCPAREQTWDRNR
jgi:hypothetical protein